MTLALRPYQEVGRDFLAARRFALLADEMRIGKTPQAILATEKADAYKVLVVCPAIAVEHWHNEWRKWSTKTIELEIFSYDMAQRFAERLLRQAWDNVIIDECHFCKNPEAQRTKLVYGKGGLGWHTRHLWVLSGTPATKHAAELWPMLRAFGVVDMTYDGFVHRYCTVNPFTLRVTGTRVSMIPELHGLLKKIMLRRTRAQVAAEIPAISFEFLTVNPSTSHRDVSLPFCESDEALLAWVESHTTTDSEDRIAVAKAKIPALVQEIVFAIENDLIQQTVVFGWHVDPLVELVRCLVDRGICARLITGATSAARRVGIQEDFRHGSVQVVAANILAAGIAVDLSAASHGYFLELDWVPGNNIQAANRLISLDKKEPVTFDVVTRPGSTDDRVQKVLLRRVQELSKLY